jgi:hypothetical protein
MEILACLPVGREKYFSTRRPIKGEADSKNSLNREHRC